MTILHGNASFILYLSGHPLGWPGLVLTKLLEVQHFNFLYERLVVNMNILFMYLLPEIAVPPILGALAVLRKDNKTHQVVNFNHKVCKI